MEEIGVEWHGHIVLAICTIGFLTFSRNLYPCATWVWSALVRRPKDLTTYGSWALITGCTDGIGKALTFELASKGLNVVLLSRNPQKLEATSKEIIQKFGDQTKTKIIALDFAKTTSGKEIEERVRKEIEGLDVGILINNAGSAAHGPSFFHELDLQDNSNTMSMVNVNIGSTTWVTRAVLPGMLKRKRGAIVNVSSGSSVVLPSFPLGSVYSATKAYVAHFSRSLSVEYKHYGIDIQCQAPFFVATNMIRDSYADQTSFFVPSAEQYSKAGTRWIGYDFMCVPYWTHALQWCLNGLLPATLVNCAMLVHSLESIKKEEEVYNHLPFPKLSKRILDVVFRIVF